MLNDYALWVVGVFCIDLVLAVIAISTFRYLQGLLAGVDTTEELSRKDNFAFGISFAGGALALAMIIAAAVGGEPSESIIAEGVNVILYSLLGIVLLKTGTLVNDRFIFHRFSLKEEVLKENISAGIVQAANFLALGFIIQSSIRWVETESWDGLISVICVFISAQIFLLSVTRLRAQIYMRRHEGQRFQDALKSGNPALAIRYAGHIIAAALGISAASNLIAYMPDTPWVSAGIWLVVSVVLALLITLLSAVARSIVLKGINIIEEVDEQHNIGVAFIEAEIFISVAIILSPIMAMLDSII